MRNSPLEIALLRGERSTVRTCRYDESTVGYARSMVAPATHFNGYFVWLHAPLSVGCQKKTMMLQGLYSWQGNSFGKVLLFRSKDRFSLLFANKKG